ncbi:hypothetical protein D3C80_1959230 [compost metagenome]
MSSDAGLAAQLQAAAHHFAQVSTDHQAQPGSSPSGLRGVVSLGERFEQALLILIGNADATVVDM